MTSSGIALAWPLDKYEVLTVDNTRGADTRKWGEEPKERSQEGAAKPRTNPITTITEATGSLAVAKQPNVSGVKRPRETNWSTDKNNGEEEPESPWQVRGCG